MQKNQLDQLKKILGVILFTVLPVLNSLASYSDSTQDCNTRGTVYSPYIETEQGEWFLVLHDDSIRFFDSQEILFGYEIIAVSADTTYIELSCLQVLDDTIPPSDTGYCWSLFYYYQNNSYDPTTFDSTNGNYPDTIPGEPHDTLFPRYSVEFYDSSSTNSITWAWSFGDGTTSNEQNPIHYYTYPGTYTVCLTIYSETGCSDSYCSEVIVKGNEMCNADFSYCKYNSTYTNKWGNKPEYRDSISFPDTIPGSDNLIIGFKNESTPNNSNSYWNFGDGTHSNNKNPVHTYQKPGRYYVTLTIRTNTGCSSSITKEVLVGDISEIDFTYTTLVPDCWGYNIAYQFIPDYNSEIIAYNWTFGDGESSSEYSPIHTYETYGEYEVCLSANTINEVLYRKCKRIVFDQDSINHHFKNKCNTTPTHALENNSEQTSVTKLFPAPAVDHTKLVINSTIDQSVSIEIINVMGQKFLIEKDYELYSGENIVDLDLTNYKSGTYVYKLMAEDKIVLGTLSIIK